LSAALFLERLNFLEGSTIFCVNYLNINMFNSKIVVRNGLKMAGNGIKWLNCGEEMVESGANVVGFG